MMTSNCLSWPRNNSREKLTPLDQVQWCSLSAIAEVCGEQLNRCSYRNGVGDCHSFCFHHRSSGRHQHQCHPSSKFSLPWKLNCKVQDHPQDIKNSKSWCGKKEEDLFTGSDVVPIRIIWGKLLECSSLHNISPVRKFNLLKTKEHVKHNNRLQKINKKSN